MIELKVVTLSISHHTLSLSLSLSLSLTLSLSLSDYLSFIYTGGGLGWMMGAVSSPLSWRWTFHILGIAGLALIPLTALSMWEPASVRASRQARRKGKTTYSIKVYLYYLLMC